MKRKIIVFEELQDRSRLLLKWYLIRGFDIFYYRIGRSCKEKSWIRAIADKGMINKIDDKYNLLNTAIGYYPDLAYQNIDKIFEAFFREDTIVKLIIKIYKDNRIYNAFKKTLLGYLQRFYYINFTLYKLNEIFPGMKIYFIPTLRKEGYRTNVLTLHEYNFFYKLMLKSHASLFETKDVIWPVWFSLICKINYLLRYAKIRLEILGFIFLSLAVSLKDLVATKASKIKYKFGVMIISPMHQFANRVRRVDFLIDEEKIKKTDTLFISGRKLSLPHRHYLREHGLKFSDNLFYKIDFEHFAEILPAALSLLADTVRFRGRKRIFLIESALRQLICFGIWQSFLERFDIENFITHCDFGLQSISRNILLSKSGTKTWYYTDAINWGNFFISDANRHNTPLYNHAIGFLVYDYFVSWSDELINYFKIHHQDIKNNINVGCLWAGHIREIRQHRIKTELPDNIRRYGFKDGYKLISVFDSTYVDYTITTYSDGVAFLKGIYCLLEEIPDIFIILKEKKPRSFIKSFSKGLILWLERLETHPRCYLPCWDMNTSEVIAFSDLTISFPFTSTTFEALSARKKAIYYDAAGKFRGAFYDNVNGLVCHNFDELLKRTKELLFDIDQPAYNKYLDEFVRGRVEPYLDGNALTRFRDLLTSGNL